MKRTLRTAISACVVAIAAACPDYASLPYVDAGPGEGEGEGEGAGEGEGEGEGVECETPTSSTLWQRLDIDAQTETRAGALLADEDAELLYVALDDGRVRTMQRNGAFEDLAECLENEQRVEARRMFIVDDVLIISGRGGVCLVDTATGDHEVVVPGAAGVVTQDADVAAVPLDEDGNDVVIMYPIVESASFRFERHARTLTTLSGATELAGDDAPLPALFIDAVATPVGAVFADEVGRVYVVEPSAPTTVRRTADFGSSNPRGLVMAATADGLGLEVAHRDSSTLFFFRIPYAQLLSGDITPGLDAISNAQEIERPAALFPYRLDAVENIAVRSDGARVDVGPFGFAAFTPPGSDEAFPLGSEQRIANISRLGALDDQSGLWAVSQNAAFIAFWQRDTVQSGAWTTRVDAATTSTLSGTRNITALSGDRALIEASDTVALATASPAGGTITLELTPSLGDPAGDFDGIAGVVLDESAQIAVIVNVGGDVFLVDTDDVGFAETVDGSIGNELTRTNFDIAVGGDDDVTAGNIVGLTAAGVFAGVPGVRRCAVTISTASLSCDEPVPLPISNEAPHEFSRVVTTSAGVLVLTNRGAALERARNVFDAITIPGGFLQDFNGDEIADTPFAAGSGDVVDLGAGCLALFGFSPFTMALDGTDDTLTIDELLPTTLNPFMTAAALASRSEGLIVGSGGLGNVFYEIDTGPFVEGTPCVDRFALGAQALDVLPPERPSLGGERAAFFGCDAVVGDELGFLWRMTLTSDAGGS